MTARDVLQALLRGEAEPAESLLARGAGDVADVLAIRAELCRALPLRSPPSRGELEACARAPGAGRGSAVRACYALGMSAVARLDDASVHAWAECARSLAAGLDGVPELECAALDAWSRFFAGALGSHEARALEVRAARLGVADVVVELAALGALCVLSTGDMEQARSIARRASRMARTEALPQAEYLAHLVLARVRRLDGHPHLATRIASALALAAPAPFHGWLALELALAGAEDRASALLGTGDGPLALAAHHVLQAFGAARRGDPAAFERALEGAREAVRGVPSFADELPALAVALDPRADPALGPPELRAFLLGHTNEPPGALAGPLSLPRDGELVGAARVVAREHGARRVLGVGLGLGGHVIEIGRESGAPQRRRETMIAVLALAGPRGLTRAELFQSVWGFPFVPHLHQGVLDVALHRLRPSLTTVAELVRRDDDRWALVVRGALAVTDPRVERLIDDRVLALVAARAGMRAREIAAELDVSLRTVQLALSRLEEDGVCVRTGEGPRTAYRVEDTTFREPTRPR